MPALASMRRRRVSGAWLGEAVPGTASPYRATSRDVLHLAARLDRVGELALEQAVLVDLAVDRARACELVVGAARDDPAVVEDDDLVRERNRRQPVGDDQRRP